MNLPPLPLQTITRAFDLLKHDVQAALHTQMGDPARLQEQIQACDRLQAQITMV
jgi:hypothetical protein